MISFRSIFRSFLKSAALGSPLLIAPFALCMFADVAQAQTPASSAANLQFNTAGGLHNRQAFDLAADEWAKFIQSFPQDKRVAEASHYLGICKLQTKDYAGAIAAFERLIALDPKFELIASSRLYLGMAQFNAAQAGKAELFAAAEKTLAALLTSHPTGKHLPQTVYFEAEALYAQNKKAPAADLYRRFVTEFAADPLLPDALYALGVTLDELGRGAEAQAAYVEFLTKFPKHALRVDVDVRRAELLSAAGDLDAAEKIFASAAATPGYDAADYALLRQAGCLYDRKRFAEAAAVYDALPKSFPGSQYKAAALLAAGKSDYFAGNYPAVAAKLAPLADGKGDAAAEASHWAGRALLKSKQPADAALRFAAALRNSPASKFAPQLMLDLADALYEQPERRAESLAAYKAVYEKFPADPLAPQARYLASFMALELGRNDEARDLAVAFLKLPAGTGANLRNDVLYINAEALLRAGKHESAVTAYDELFAAVPTQHADRAKWIVRRALALSLAGKHAGVIDSLAKQADLLGDPALKSEARHLLGLSRQATNDYAGAIADFRAALQAAPERLGSDDTLLALAETNRLAGNAAGAQAALSEFLAKYPKSRLRDTAEYRSAELAYAAGDLKGAEAAYRRVLDGYPQSTLVPYARYGLSWALIGQGDAAGAITALDGLLKSAAPAELAAKARYARALAHQQLEHFDLAIADLNEFLKSKPTGKDLTDAYYVLGLCQEGIGKNTDALATFEKLLQSDTRYAGTPKVLYEIGWIRKNAGNAKESAAAFGRLAKEFPQSEQAAEALFHVGEEAYARKDYAAAVDAYYDAREKSDSAELTEKSAHKLGWSYFHQDKFPKAEEWFRFQQKNFPNGKLAQDAAFMEGESQFKQAKYKEALASYTRVKSPQGPDFALLSLLHAGQAAAQLEDWSGSLQLLDAAAQLNPKSPYLPEINYERGWAKYQSGAADEALAIFEKVTEETDREIGARARFMIGEIYFTRKNHTEAVKHFFKVAYGYAYPEWQARSQFEAGRCFEVLGKLDQAKRSYQEVVDKYSKYEEAALAKKRLADLGK
ncbi:MAG: tetratricopeptide repeat protein [Planctomycetia bacterium]|nr:tetratricopeptide repeat protein [Planctomycetia bacterium]